MAGPLVLVRQRAWLWVVVSLAAVLVAALLLTRRGGLPDTGTTFVAKRDRLDIVVLEGGGIESEEKGEVKCEVKGPQGVKILKIVPEGYQVTEDDVKTNKLLVELDSSELRKQITQQEITFGSTEASLTDAQQGYDIQLNQNISDVMAALQKAQFARMDFDKYMGEQAAAEIVARMGIQTNLLEEGMLPTNELARVASNPAPGVQVGGGTPASPTDKKLDPAVAAQRADASPSRPADAQTITARYSSQSPAVTNAGVAEIRAALAARRSIDFSQYAKIEVLGDGEAKQKLRELQDAVQMAQREMQQAQSTFEGTLRLFEKNFVPRIERDRDQLAYDNNKLKVRKAETALELFEKYEFPKAAQESLSKFTESLRELDRTRKGSISKLAQAEAKLKSAQAKYSLEERQLKELYDQLDKCTIRAPRPGLVVYGTGEDIRPWRDEEQIREGATVRERQTVLTIPDMRKMSIKVKINESYIRRIQKGQKVRIIADSFPDRKLEGEVAQVGVLPDSEDSWLNPDMKRYRTTIAVNGQHDWIRPGMNAKVQILVNQLSNVVHVPLLAVKSLEDKKVCYVMSGNRVEQREIELGEFNDEFVEVRAGIKEGDRVCLRTPSGWAGDENRAATNNAGGAKKSPKAESRSAASGAGAGLK